MSPRMPIALLFIIFSVFISSAQQETTGVVIWTGKHSGPGLWS
jgi:hypothetical protein